MCTASPPLSSGWLLGGILQSRGNNGDVTLSMNSTVFHSALYTYMQSVVIWYCVKYVCSIWCCFQYSPHWCCVKSAVPSPTLCWIRPLWCCVKSAHPLSALDTAIQASAIRAGDFDWSKRSQRLPVHCRRQSTRVPRQYPTSTQVQCHCCAKRLARSTLRLRLRLPCSTEQCGRSTSTGCDGRQQQHKLLKCLCSASGHHRRRLCQATFLLLRRSSISPELNPIEKVQGKALHVTYIVAIRANSLHLFPVHSRFVLFSTFPFSFTPEAPLRHINSFFKLCIFRIFVSEQSVSNTSLMCLLPFHLLFVLVMLITLRSPARVAWYEGSAPGLYAYWYAALGSRKYDFWPPSGASMRANRGRRITPRNSSMHFVLSHCHVARYALSSRVDLRVSSSCAGRVRSFSRITVSIPDVTERHFTESLVSELYTRCHRTTLHRETGLRIDISLTSCTRLRVKYIVVALSGQQGGRSIQDATNTLKPR